MNIKWHKLLLIIIFTLLAGLFIFLSIAAYERETFSFDDWAFEFTHSSRNDLLSQIALAITFLGSQTFLLPANIILAGIFLFIHKKRSYIWKIAAISLSSSGFLFLVKYIIKKPRPATPLHDAAMHFSFPSGHTFTSITFFGMVLYFLFYIIKNKIARLLLVLFILSIIVAIAWSRVYLNVHYASDVIAGFCLGIMWLIMADWLLLKKDSHRINKPDLS